MLLQCDKCKAVIASAGFHDNADGNVIVDVEITCTDCGQIVRITVVQMRPPLLDKNALDAKRAARMQATTYDAPAKPIPLKAPSK